ncbi:hypothetical protein M513_05741 [Trichuris suis]|uniref:Uncharacterized protein n=1 Tax=Trichuris suis TaxID=68888 RepID=A0A085M7R4_9BILA|nr:hypothetical protein M513_05741 [Trichuris suis]
MYAPETIVAFDDNDLKSTGMDGPSEQRITMYENDRAMCIGSKSREPESCWNKFATVRIKS